MLACYGIGHDGAPVLIPGIDRYRGRMGNQPERDTVNVTLVGMTCAGIGAVMGGLLMAFGSNVFLSFLISYPAVISFAWYLERRKSRAGSN